MVVLVPHRSTEPGRPRHRRELSGAPGALVNFHTGRDLAPAGNFATYARAYPGLYSAVSGLPMGQVPELAMKPSDSKKPTYPGGFYKALAAGEEGDTRKK